MQLYMKNTEKQQFYLKDRRVIRLGGPFIPG